MLKYIFYIFIFIIGLNFTSSAQNKQAGSPEPAAKILKIYPIPATSVINFDFQRAYDRSLVFQIYNFPGKKVYEATNLPQKIAITLNDYYRGIYYYKLVDKDGKTVESGRFLVVK